MPDLRNNRVCTLLGCAVPVVLAGMGGVARSELAAAVIDAGGFGFLGMVREPPELIEREVRSLRSRGHERFGVNIIPATTGADLLERQMQTCIRLRVPVIALFWDIDPAVVSRFRDAGMTVVYQVGSVEEAIAVERAGAQMVIAQGREAGGHVRGTERLRDLLPKVVRAVSVPVLAAGGLSTGGDLVTAMALGAEGVALGTAMLATEESFAHDYHKQRLLTAEGGDTVLTETFHINWPPAAAVRVLRSEVTFGVRGTGDEADKTVIGEEEGRPIYLFSTDSPLRSMTGDFAAMALYAGTGVGRIRAIRPARERVEAIVAQAEMLLRDGAVEAGVANVASPVCYAQEISGAYMGYVDEAERAAQLAELAGKMVLALALVLAEEANGRHVGEPAFAEAGYAYAAWSVLLRELVAGDAVIERLAEMPVQAEIGGELRRLHADMIGQLGTLMPRLPEDDIRQRLAPLLPFLENQRLLRMRQEGLG